VLPYAGLQEQSCSSDCTQTASPRCEQSGLWAMAVALWPGVCPPVCASGVGRAGVFTSSVLHVSCELCLSAAGALTCAPPRTGRKRGERAVGAGRRGAQARQAAARGAREARAGAAAGPGAHGGRLAAHRGALPRARAGRVRHGHPLVRLGWCALSTSWASQGKGNATCCADVLVTEELCACMSLSSPCSACSLNVNVFKNRASLASLTVTPV
jgi:hypothetical protein